MSGLAELSRRFGRLQEIRNIMTAMKNLSLVETHKLARFMAPQHEMLANIEAALSDFRHFHALESRIQPASPAIVLVIGSARGFCGSFNERLFTAFHALPAWPSSPRLIIVGQRLATRFGEDSGHSFVAGATISEEVPTQLIPVMEALNAASLGKDAPATIFSLAHNAEGELALRAMLPPPMTNNLAFQQAPDTTIPAPELGKALIEQYLLATLQSLLYESLNAENRQRLAHMENALDRLEETIAHLALKRNALRQEKIIEEIEVMLSSQTLAERRDPPRSAASAPVVLPLSP